MQGRQDCDLRYGPGFLPFIALEWAAIASSASTGCTRHAGNCTPLGGQITGGNQSDLTSWRW